MLNSNQLITSSKSEQQSAFTQLKTLITSNLHQFLIEKPNST